MWGKGALILLASLALGLAIPTPNVDKTQEETLEYMLEKEAESVIKFDKDGEHIVSTKTISVYKFTSKCFVNVAVSPSAIFRLH